MVNVQQITFRNKINVRVMEKLSPAQLVSLCQIAEATMLDTYGFRIGSKRWHPPMKCDLEKYFSGVMLISERKLILVSVEETIVGSVQLLLPHALNQTSNFAVSLHDLFVVRTARNSGLAEKMLRFVENYCKELKYKIIKLSIRSDMIPAITLIEKLGYKRWGVLDKFEMLGDTMMSGYFYYKDL